jgi:hypothetical protein
VIGQPVRAAGLLAKRLSMLEMIEGDRQEELHELIRRSFDWAT